MSEVGGDDPSERWRQLIGSLDAERNLRAAAGMLAEAASSSERLLDSLAGRGGAEGTGDLRDVRVELERSFDQFASVVKRFLLDLPVGRAGNDRPDAGARIAVLDGIGTTVLEIPGADGAVRCGPLLRHDGSVLDADRVTVVRSNVLDGDVPAFVVRVDVPEGTPPGTYHGQVVASGLPDFAVPLTVTVVGEPG